MTRKRLMIAALAVGGLLLVSLASGANPVMDYKQPRPIAIDNGPWYCWGCGQWEVIAPFTENTRTRACAGLIWFADLNNNGMQEPSEPEAHRQVVCQTTRPTDIRPFERLR